MKLLRVLIGFVISSLIITALTTCSPSSPTPPPSAMDISDRQLRAALMNNSLLESLGGGIRIDEELGTGIHEGKTFVLALWPDDQPIVQWTLEGNAVTKIAVIVDPDAAVEPYLVEFQIQYVKALTELVVPEWDSDGLGWIFDTWEILSQQDNVAPSASTSHGKIKITAIVYTVPNTGVVEFTSR